jgi:predicted dehydrogenase
MSIGVGVIGYGYWGPNIVRNFMETPGLAVRAISDLSEQRRGLAAMRCPGAKVTADYKELLKDSSIDAIVVATPVGSHYGLASEALKAGKHVLVEKPMTASVEQARRLVDEAASAKRVLMVDHTFVYTSAVRKIKELIAAGTLGELYYYDSVRVNLGLFQHDVNVIWDLAPHDASIVEYLIDQQVACVSCLAMSHVPNQPENVGYITMMFNSPIIVHLHVNWLAPVKIRQTLIGGSARMIVYDDMELSEKVKIYDRGVELASSTDRIHELRIGYRSGDMHAPKIELTEALHVEAAHFKECMEHGKTPITDGQAGLRVVQMLEAASHSIKHRGRLIDVATMQPT